jgi:hypothetical protein
VWVLRLREREAMPRTGLTAHKVIHLADRPVLVVR